MKDGEAPKPESRPILITAMRYAVLGVFALVVVCLGYRLAEPKPDPGSVDFEGFEHEGRWAKFVYHPPQKQGHYWVHYKCVDMETGKELTKETFIVVDNPPVAKNLDHFDFLTPTNAVWRVTAMVKEKRRRAWGALHLYPLGAIASQPITNPWPGTLSPWPRR